jgi:hypothetical protein
MEQNNKSCEDREKHAVCKKLFTGRTVDELLKTAGKRNGSKDYSGAPYNQEPFYHVPFLSFCGSSDCRSLGMVFFSGKSKSNKKIM